VFLGGEWWLERSIANGLDCKSNTIVHQVGRPFKSALTLAAAGPLMDNRGRLEKIGGSGFQAGEQCFGCALADYGFLFSVLMALPLFDRERAGPHANGTVNG